MSGIGLHQCGHSNLGLHVSRFSGTFYLVSFEESRSGTKLRGRAFAHGAMGRRIDPSWGGPIELFLVPASAPRLV